MPPSEFAIDLMRETKKNVQSDKDWFKVAELETLCTRLRIANTELQKLSEVDINARADLLFTIRRHITMARSIHTYLRDNSFLDSLISDLEEKAQEMTPPISHLRVSSHPFISIPGASPSGFENYKEPPISQIIYEYFRDLPNIYVDQREGDYNREEGCCVGAHLARILDEFGDIQTPLLNTMNDYIMGAAAWTKLIAEPLGGSILHAQALLQDAGAGDVPFGPKPWPTPPADVFQKLLEVEKLPSLSGRNMVNWLQPCDIAYIRFD